MSDAWNRFKKNAVSLLYPEYRCIFCGRECEDIFYNVCNVCKLEAVKMQGDKLCRKCGTPLENEFAKFCGTCKRLKYSFDKSCSVFYYDELTSRCVFALKYNGEKFKAKFMARLMVDKLYETKMEFDEICFVPLHNSREKTRGYNQAKLIADEISRLTGKPLALVLERVKSTPSQTTLSAKDRKDNLKGAFKVLSGADTVGKNYLCVDDVFTTGVTLDECAKTLKKANAKSVNCVTFAKVVLDE